MVELADSVDLILKKFNHLEKQSRAQLNGRDTKIFKAAEQLGVYAGQMDTPGPGGYVAKAGQALERAANKYKEMDAKLLADFCCRLTSWLAERKRNIEMQVKHMEDMRKEMQKAEKKAQTNPDQFTTGAEAAKEAWTRTCSETADHMKKFISDADEMKKLTAQWLQKEKALDGYNKDQCAGVATGKKPARSKEVKDSTEKDDGDGGGGEE